jgi:hypothetical protein
MANLSFEIEETISLLNLDRTNTLSINSTVEKEELIDTLQIKGFFVLKRHYSNKFEHEETIRIPIDISLPLNKVIKIEEVNLFLTTFESRIDGDKLNLTIGSTLTGVSKDMKHATVSS